MAGNILISFNADGVIKVDYSGDKDSPFGLNDVDLLRAVMACEGMFIAQTGLSIDEMRELLDDERLESKVHTDTKAFDIENAVVVVEDDDGEVS